MNYDDFIRPIKPIIEFEIFYKLVVKENDKSLEK